MRPLRIQHIPRRGGAGVRPGLAVMAVALACMTLAWRAGAQPEPGAAAPAAPPQTSPGPAAPPPATAASTNVEAALPPVTGEEIAALKARVEGAELSEAQRTQAMAAIEAAAASLGERTALLAQVTQRQQEIDGAPTSLQNARAALAAPAGDPAASVPSDIGLGDLEQRLSQARSALETARAQVASLEAEPASRQARRDAIPGELASARQSLEQAEAAAVAPPSEGTPAEVSAAATLAARARVDLASARIDALQRELASLDARRELLTTRIDLARREVAERDAMVKYLDARLADARRAEAARQAEEARRALETAAEAHPAVQSVLRETQRFAARLADDPQTGAPGARSLAEDASARVSQAQTRLSALAGDYAATFDRVEAIGLTDAMGRLLREKRRTLEDPADLEAQIRQDRETRAAILLELFELRPLGESWGEPATVAADVAAREPGLTDEQRRVLREQLQKAMEARRDAYRQLVGQSGALESYQSSLGQLDELNRARLDLLREYIGRVERTVLWVPSHHAIGRADLSEIGAGLSWLRDAGAWSRVGRGLLDEARDRPFLTFGPVLALLLFALLVRPWLGRATDRMHDRARKVATDRFGLTMRALVFGALIALLLPGMLLAVSEILLSAGAGVEQARAVAIGLRTAASVLFAMALTRRITRRNGLAEVHFRWSTEVTQSIRAKITWLTPIAVLTHPLITGVSADPNTPGGPALVRVALVVWLVSLAVALQRVLRPGGVSMQHFLAAARGSWIEQLRWLWYPLAIATPLGLAGVSLLGYIETARQLEDRFLDTLALVLALVLVTAVVTRWVALARRRVAMEQARRRREALEAERAKELGGETPATPTAPVEEASLEEIDAQTKQLLRFGVGLCAILGIWGLWVGVLPALGMLDRVQLYPQVRIVDEAAGVREHRPWREVLDRGAAIEPSTHPNEKPAIGTVGAADGGLPSASAGDGADGGVLTLGDLLTAVVLGFATAVAAKNIPGVLEILLLQHLPLDRGSRYAISSIVRYVIVIVGASATLSAVGIGWSRVQWLAAALTFGLGFGLQEIFANFVSGIIMLAERPIRIGDIVTVGDVTGTVSRIQMRATTVVDWDKRELIVPNRSFITGSVINWTLSDPSTRVVIPVGVAYGTDPNLVKRLLLNIGKANRYLKDPPEPAAWFRDFGASSLNFELRFFIKNVDDSLSARDEALRAIDREFKDAGIEIAFPQMDLHIRDLPPDAPGQGAAPANAGGAAAQGGAASVTAPKG